jgi:uncharacterized membrane protein YgcG
MLRLLVLLLAALARVAAADERIVSFDSTITVGADSSLTVTETLRVRAEGIAIKRGIFREFPTDYLDKSGNKVRVGFDLLSVSRAGRAEPYRTERQANGVRILIGDPDVFLTPGDHTYEITYRTDRTLGYFDQHDELYWNVTGNGWRFPIDQVRARVLLPRVPPDAVRLEAYTGPQGATWRHYRAEMVGAMPTFETTRPLAAHQGLTIVVSWPKGFVTAPGALARLRHLARDNLPAAYAGFGLLALLGYYVWIWLRVGRDPPQGVVMPRYRPPEGESPASMRFLRRMGYDNRCFAAAVLSLAVKGYLSIEREGGVLGLGRKYALFRREGSSTPLSPDETALLPALFPGTDHLALEDGNHVRISAARAAHRRALESKYSKGFFQINGGWHLLGVALSLAACALAIALPAAAGGFGLEWFVVTPGGWVAAGTLVLALLVNGVFGKLLKSPTREGRRRLDEIDGFRLYLEVAEGDEIKLVGAPRKTAALFESYLPFALALGVEQRWAEQFAAVFLTQAPSYHPDWYEGGFDVRDVGRFSASFGGSFESAISSAATPPGSSSGSSGGSDGGGGGGGSSGGGGGGGGGGGW